MAGGNRTQVSGNVDLMPTMLELAAGDKFVEAVNPDGKSMAGWLLGREDESGWRDSFLNEYLSVGTYYNDHSNCWEDGSNTTHECGGPMPRGPKPAKHLTCVESTGVADGNCYFVDSTHSNTWRQLRIVNSSMNMNYIEYDSRWLFNGTGPTGAGMQHYELYDIAADPYQMKNLYKVTSDATKAALHAQLRAYFNCRGASCP